MKTLRPFFFVCLALVFPILAIASTRIALDEDWRFRTDPKGEGQRLNWTKSMPDSTEAVRLPHTWNIDAHDDYEGVAWYFRRIDLPDALLGTHLELHFGATFYEARVWLNGVELGRHEGGYTEYFFDITPHVYRTNYLAVQIDNRPGVATIPGWAMRLHSGGNIWYDWWHYGGIVRGAWIAASYNALIRRQQIRTQVQAQTAAVSNRVYLENTGKQVQQFRIEATVLAPDGSLAAHVSQRNVKLQPGTNDVLLLLSLLQPRRWSIDHPNLYEMHTELFDAQNRLLDARTDTFGVRRIEIRDRHLLVNGERVRLSGMTRHEETLAEGLAETPGSMLHDYNDMKSLEVTLTRPVHYPQNPYILDYADRNGILLVPEIPLWQFSARQLSDPKVITLAKQMMREMIEQAGNHPSIFAWSVCNESETATLEGRAYVRQMKALIRELDPDRFVTFADDSLPNITKAEDSASIDADFIMMNQYFGTWAGSASRLPEVLDNVDRMYPQKMLVISEFGAVGVFAANSVEADQLRRDIIRSQLAEFARRDWIAGAILWCYQDYKSHRNLWPGLTEGFVDHGVVDENHQRRPSYDVWKELNAPARIEATFNGGPYNPTDGFSATIARRPYTELPSYPLHDYRARWEVRDGNNTLVASGDRVFGDLEHPQNISGNWKTREAKVLTLTLTLVRPTGFVAAEKRVQWRLVQPGGQQLPQLQPDHLPY